MQIGHINLAKSFNGTGEHFVALVEALDRQGIRQHIVVRNKVLAGRLSIYKGVSMGPVTGSPVLAYCLMPQVDLVHAHDERSAQASLLLALTRSIPFVLTRRRRIHPSGHPLLRSIYARASSVICTTNAGAMSVANRESSIQLYVVNDIARAATADIELLANRVAAEHLRIYHRAIDTVNVPALLL